ncbi:MAG: type III polyketide synthase [Bacteroidetes bacterium]|nr:type III polyketide synthase [Bacteroidota bacterium]
MSNITSIGIANPEHKIEQSTIANFMVKAMKLSEDDERKLRALHRMSGIETRYSVLNDYSKTEHFEFYSNTSDVFPGTKQRSELFQKHAIHLAASSAEKCLSRVADLKRSEITHLVVVSCTGMYAPGLDIDLVKVLGLKSSIERTCINFMGCYAAFNALKLAHSFCDQNPQAKVLVVCVELCSIHFQREATEDNLLANSLFADGSAALLIEAQPREGINLKPLSFFCDIATSGEHDMAWSIGDFGFEMRLSSYVPDVIKGGIKKLTASLLEKINFQLSDISLFAIHPGGKKILEAIETELAVSKEQNQFAYQVLKKYGNMSSPTVLFVLHELASTLQPYDAGKRVLSFAFGPGLTLESMVLEVVNHK